MNGQKKIVFGRGKANQNKKEDRRYCHNRFVEIYFSHFVLIFFSTEKINQSKNKAKLEKNLGEFNFASQQFKKFRVNLISRPNDPTRFRDTNIREKSVKFGNREI